jgi:hypothetical protein
MLVAPVKYRTIVVGPECFTPSIFKKKGQKSMLNGLWKGYYAKMDFSAEFYTTYLR